MKIVFLSTSISDKIDASGSVLPEFRAFIEVILAGLREAGLGVSTAVEYDGWKLDQESPPEIGIRKDIAEVDAADVLVALVHDKPSAGVQFEIGYAVAKGKQVIVARHNRNQLAHFNQGAVSSGFMTLVPYDDDTEALVGKLVLAINAPDK